MEVIINGRSAFTLGKEEQATMYFHQLRTVEVQCQGSEYEFCIGKYFIHLCYDLNTFYCNSSDLHFNCRLSDKHGNPSDTFHCQEIKERKNITCTLSYGETITLQKINILNKGYITVTVTKKERFVSCAPFPFNL